MRAIYYELASGDLARDLDVYVYVYMYVRIYVYKYLYCCKR